jgi:hypothetical protein
VSCVNLTCVSLIQPNNKQNIGSLLALLFFGGLKRVGLAVVEPLQVMHSLFSMHILFRFHPSLLPSLLLSALWLVVWSCLCSVHSTVQRSRDLSLFPCSREGSLCKRRGAKKRKEKKDIMDSTPHCSRVVPHPSTKRAQTALTSVFG